jgi:F-type H+-transporting ATPase subunit epsilon
MEATYKVQILTPEKTVLAGEIVAMVAPGSEGFLGVLAHHAPLITALQPGPLTLTFPGGRREVYFVGGGFLEVAEDNAVILADSAERPEEIDVSRAEAAAERARQRLREHAAGLDVTRAETSLRRALTRIKLAGAPRVRT